MDTISNSRTSLWLSQQDLTLLAQHHYHWTNNEDSSTHFEVVGSVTQYRSLLSRNLSRLTEDYSAVYILNMGNYHWVPLVLTLQDNEMLAYYVDSLGKDNKLLSGLSEIRNNILNTKLVWSVLGEISEESSLERRLNIFDLSVPHQQVSHDAQRWY